MMDRILYVSDEVEKVIFINVLEDQISNGYWSLSSPRIHYLFWQLSPEDIIVTGNLDSCGNNILNCNESLYIIRR